MAPLSMVLNLKPDHASGRVLFLGEASGNGTSATSVGIYRKVLSAKMNAPAMGSNPKRRKT
jgi:hypothetical protein